MPTPPTDGTKRDSNRYAGTYSRVVKRRVPDRMGRVQYPDWHPVWRQPGLGFAAKLLWRIAAEEHSHPISGEAATVALGTGYSHILHDLNEHLEAEGHPFAHVIDWRGLPRAVELNDHVVPWLQQNEKAAYLWGTRPGRNIPDRAGVILHAPRSTGFGKFAKSLAPLGFTPEQIRDALSRISMGTDFGGALSHSWSHLHETEPGQPLEPMEYDREARMMVPSKRPLHELVRDPSTNYHLSDAARFVSPAPARPEEE